MTSSAWSWASATVWPGVQVAGFVTLHYTGTTAPSVGECALAGDGKGGVAVTENAKKYRVLRVDTAAKTVGLYL